MAPAYVVAYNATDRPVTIDDEGRVLGGHEWGPVNRAAGPAKAALDAERLVELDKPRGDLPPDVQAAIQAATELDQRATAFGRLTADELRSIADDHELPGDVTGKAELVDVLTARTTIPAPTAGKAKEQ